LANGVLSLQEFEQIETNGFINKNKKNSNRNIPTPAETNVSFKDRSI
jgi:hypothetical protein